MHVICAKSLVWQQKSQAEGLDTPSASAVRKAMPPEDKRRGARDPRDRLESFNQHGSQAAQWFWEKPESSLKRQILTEDCPAQDRTARYTDLFQANSATARRARKSREGGARARRQLLLLL